MDPTQRFTTRVEDYVRYRPGYPRGVVDVLVAYAGLRHGAQVVDVGSGTGLLAERFLRYGAEVWGVEPNDAMRAAGERYLAEFPAFHSRNGRAEATTLPDASFDMVVAGQAAHWFEPEPARQEFARVLRAGRSVALIWNRRRQNGSPFLMAYEAVMHRVSTDYQEVNRRRGPERVAAFFANGRFETVVMASEQAMDLDGLLGRVASTSSAPPPGHPNHAPMVAALESLYREHAVDGNVVFLYDTEVYVGKPV